MQRVLSVFVVIAVLMGLTACGGDKPVSSFDTKAPVVFAAYNRSGDLTRPFDVPRGIRQITIFSDCTAGDADMEVEVSGVGGGSGGCTDRRSKTSNVTLTFPPGKTMKPGRHTVKVTLDGKAADDVKWSVAVTAS